MKKSHSPREAITYLADNIGWRIARPLQLRNCPSWPGGVAAPKAQPGWWFKIRDTLAKFAEIWNWSKVPPPARSGAPFDLQCLDHDPVCATEVLRVSFFLLAQPPLLARRERLLHPSVKCYCPWGRGFLYRDAFPLRKVLIQGKWRN